MEKLNLNINYYIMKRLVNFLNEAKSPAPSALKKFDKGSRKVNNVYIDGDIYDFTSDNTSTKTDSYYEGNGDGYIMSKDGRVFDVNCYEGTSDAGRIAGGSFDISVVIFKVGPNQENIGLSGHSAIFSRPSSPTYGSLISDIKDGIYLEDYLAYHKLDIDYVDRKNDWVKELIDAGDGTGSRTEKMKKRDAKIAKEESFNQRYCVINNAFYFSCTGGQSLVFTKSYAHGGVVAVIKPSSTKRKANISSEEEKDVRVPEEVNASIVDVVKPLAESIVKEMFGSADVSGMTFKFGVTFEGQQIIGGPVFGFDTKKKKLVILDLEKRKVLDRKYELHLESIFYDNYIKEIGELSDFAKEFFDNVSKLNIKALGTEREYIANTYKSVLWSERYEGKKIKASEAKEICKDKFDMLKRKEMFDPKKRFYVSPKIAAEVLGGKSYKKFFKTAESEAPSETDVAQIETPEITNGPDKPKPSTKSASETYGKAYGPAKEKMEKWHAGTRRQNLKNCNDGKLRMNYAICKELGFKTEMDLIKKEAESRGIILESMLSMKDYILARL